jgi:ribonuclease HI
MELLGAIRAMEALNDACAVTLYSDSTYVVNGIEKGWAENWRRSNWLRKGNPVPNWDLWKEMLQLAERHTLTCLWVRGHSGHPENERCDQLARNAAKGADLPTDRGYEAPPSTT